MDIRLPGNFNCSYNVCSIRDRFKMFEVNLHNVFASMYLHIQCILHHVTEAETLDAA